MTEKMKTVEVAVTVSEPYFVIGGGWSGPRMERWPRRDYKAQYDGKTYQNTVKSEIGRIIRAAAYRNGERVRLTFVSDTKR